MFAFSDIFDYLCMTIYLCEHKTIRWLVKVLFYHTSMIMRPRRKKEVGGEGIPYLSTRNDNTEYTVHGEKPRTCHEEKRWCLLYLSSLGLLHVFSV